MRKALILFLIVLLVFSAGFSIAHGLVNDTKDQVTWEESVILGDSGVLDGLTVTARNEQSNQLLWETTGVLGGELNPTTAFTFSNDHVSWEEEYHYDGLHMFPASDILALHQVDEELTPFAKNNYPELIQFVRDSYNSVKNGDPETFFTIDMTEYTDYYPLDGWVNIPNCPWGHYNLFQASWFYDIPESVYIYLNDYFKIPIVGDYFIEFSVNKESNGSTSMGGSATLTYEPSFHGIASSDATYFSFNALLEDGTVADTSLIPGGYGIYRLNYSYTDEITFQPGDPLVEMVYPLDPYVEYAGLTLSDDEKHLYLHTYEGDNYMRTVIDIETMTALHTIQLTQRQEDVYFELSQYDDFLVVMNYGDAFTSNFSVFEEDENGLYSFCFTVPVDSDVFSPSFQMDIMGYGDYDMDFNGSKLAIAQNVCIWNEEHIYSYDDICDFYVLVYDASGMVYAGLYKVNLADINASPTRQGGPCRPFYEAPIEVNW